MKRNIQGVVAVTLAALAGTLLTKNAVAGDYDYEASLTYGSADTKVVLPVFTFVPPSEPIVSSITTSSDSDRVELSGTWYYSGLSDTSGPKSRAAFLDRASGARISYAYQDLSGTSVYTGLQPPVPQGVLPNPPSNDSVDGNSHALEVRLRHVWKANGWYGLAGATRIDSELGTNSDGVGQSFDTDATAYTLGIGKYLGQSTALDLSIIASDLDGYDTTAYALSFNHVGSIGGSWHYAADLGVALSDEDEDDGTYSLGLSLFPTTEFEFGIRVTHHESAFDSDRDSYEGFASWFVRDRVELHARYQENDWDIDVASEYDSDQYAIGVNVRF